VSEEILGASQRSVHAREAMEIKFTDSAGLIALGAVLLGLVLFPEFAQVIGKFLGRKIELQWKTRTRVGVGMFGVALMIIGILLPFCYSPTRAPVAPAPTDAETATGPPTHTPTTRPTTTSTPTMTPVPTDPPTPIPTPTPAVVALKTYHDRYVTALGQDGDWRLKAEATEIGTWETFTLLCLDNGKIALRTYHNRYVTALAADWAWILRAETSDLWDYEKFTPVDADTEEQLDCLDVFELLKKGDVKIALKNWDNRYVTALGQDNDWWLKAETRDLLGYEKFTVIPQ
jgi:hypothetical protein